jgi:hypothetical protein
MVLQCCSPAVLQSKEGEVEEVGGASAYGGLEAEGQEFFASCLSEAILKRSAPKPKGPLSQPLISTIPSFHGGWVWPVMI